MTDIPARLAALGLALPERTILLTLFTIAALALVTPAAWAFQCDQPSPESDARVLSGPFAVVRARVVSVEPIANAPPTTMCTGSHLCISESGAGPGYISEGWPENTHITLDILRVYAGNLSLGPATIAASVGSGCKDFPCEAGTMGDIVIMRKDDTWVRPLCGDLTPEAWERLYKEQGQ